MIDQRLAPLGAFALRVTSGAFFIAHAALKAFVFTPAGTARFFEGLGIPGPLAYLVIALEALGGLALVLGVMTRPTSLALAALLVPATIAVHIANGFFFNNPNGGWEYPAFWIVALVAQALIGDGAYALLPSAPARGSAAGATLLHA